MSDLTHLIHCCFCHVNSSRLICNLHNYFAVGPRKQPYVFNTCPVPSYALRFCFIKALGSIMVIDWYSGQIFQLWNIGFKSILVEQQPGGGEEGGCRGLAELLGRILPQLGLGQGRVGSPSSRGRGEQDQTQLEARQRVTAGHHTWPDYVLLCSIVSIYLSLFPS